MFSIGRTFFPALCLFVACAFPAAAQVRYNTATDASGNQIKIEGSVVLVEPDVELSLVTAGGLTEPRQEWSETARRLLPAEIHTVLQARGTQVQPDMDIPDDLAADSQLGQIVRLNQAVALSIAQFSAPGSVLATKTDARGKPRLDWSLGEGVAVLREATGADYALFTYVRDSYASGGRKAMRAFGFLLGAAMGSYMDIGGGLQLSVTTLVDLRTGQVVWFNLMTDQNGDLRDAQGTRDTVKQLLTGLPL
jgi:hypothetical protein